MELSEEQEAAWVSLCYSVAFTDEGEESLTIPLGTALSLIDLIGSLHNQIKEYEECICPHDWYDTCTIHGYEDDKTFGMDDGFWDAIRELRLAVGELAGQIPIVAEVIGIWDEAQHQGAPVEWSWVLRSEDVTLPDDATWGDLDVALGPMRSLEAALEEPENHWQPPLGIGPQSLFGFYWSLRDGE